MRKLSNLLVSILFAVLFLAACTYHNEDYYFKDNPTICYTEDMSYSNDIKPIFESNCISCHNSIDLTADVDLSSFNTLVFLADSGLLLGVVRHDEGFYNMPPNGDQLSDCAISKIEEWINQGMKNN